MISPRPMSGQCRMGILASSNPSSVQNWNEPPVKAKASEQVGRDTKDACVSSVVVISELVSVGGFKVLTAINLKLDDESILR